jgi:hypothetical protein
VAGTGVLSPSEIQPTRCAKPNRKITATPLVMINVGWMSNFTNRRNLALHGAVLRLVVSGVLSWSAMSRFS